MHRELRVWNPEIPESSERLDPILRILLQLYSHQLSRIDKRIDRTWEVAVGSLIKSLSPESKKWPVPAFTVMRCQPADPVVEVDPHTRFFYKEKREGGQTFFFSSMRKERILSAQVKHVFLKRDDSIVDLSPSSEQAKPQRAPVASPVSPDAAGQLFIAVDYDGSPTDFVGATLFLRGASKTVKQLRWACWYPGSNNGSFYEDCGFCPGLTGSIVDNFTPGGQEMDWGGLRTGTDLFRPLEDSFVALEESFAASWEMGPVNEQLTGSLARNGVKIDDLSENYYWIRLDLPPGGDRSKFQSPLGIFFDCFVAVNKNELTQFKHTGGNRLVELELPEPIASVLEIVKVVDSSGREYTGLSQIQADRSQRCYSLEERRDKLVLWFDLSSPIELPPDSITVTYTTTAGVSANGIEAGKIAELYDSHPGIQAAENLIPTAGAIPAKTDQQIIAEASARLRNRDRALSFTEIANWAQTFDPRIKRVTCENGIERAARGVRRCIVVKVAVNHEEFHSEDETSLLQQRVHSFLKSRSPVNTQYKVEIVTE